jgi:hypothetical protein
MLDTMLDKCVDTKNMKPKELTEYYNKMSVAEKTHFYEKCSKDPIFYIENCVMAPTTGQDALVKLYKPQKDIIKTFLEENYIIMNKSRQTGGSLVVQALCSWLVLFYENYVIGVVSRSGGESSKFNKKILDILDKIPVDFIRPKPEDFTERNAQSFKLGTTMSEVISQAVSPVNPEGILRGNTIALLVIDECAFINNIEKAYTAILPATSQAHEAAKKAGIPHGNFIISTPNGMKGRGEFYFRMWNKAISGTSIYKPKEIHWRDIPGLDDVWYKKQCDGFDNDPKKIAQEMELQFISSDGSLWEEHIQSHFNKLMNNLNEDDPYKILTFNEGGTLYIYKPDYDMNRFCIIGVDTAGASGTDMSVIQVIDHATCEHVAEFIGKMEPLRFANKFVKKLAIMYPNNIIVVENSGGYGLTVLNSLQDDEVCNFNVFGEDKLSSQVKGKNRELKHIPGLSTNVRTRPLIIESITNYVKENLDLVISKRLASELLTLENRNEKIQAGKNYHDDLVMAMAFCFYVRAYAPDSISDLVGSYRSNSQSSGYNMNSEQDEIDSLVNIMGQSIMNVNTQYDKFGLKEDEFNKILNRYNNVKHNDEHNQLASHEDNFFGNMFSDSIKDTKEMGDDDIYGESIFLQDLY